MTLKIIKCEQSSIDCFLKKVTEEGFGTITSIENCKKSHKTSIVLGKIVKFIYTNSMEKCVKIIVREVLPDGTYGVKFKAIIQDALSKLFIDAALCIGDRLGFFEPNVFYNPAFQSQEDIGYVLQIGGNKQSVMWYAKKQYILALPPKSKSTDKQLQQKEMSPKEMKKTDNKVIQGSNNNKNNSPETRRKLQTPAQSPSNSPKYTYKKLAKVKYDALHGDLQRVNIIAIVSEISKGLSKTATGKFTIICKLVDDSVAVDGELINFDLHFFTPESTVISEIEQGDILCLHRVKVELYMNDVDGRVFYSHDLVLFKKNSPVSKPLSTIKNISLSEEEKRRILHLKDWYKEKYGTYLNSMFETSNITLLSAIKREGDYSLVCKVVSQPLVTSSKIILCLSDGSVMRYGALSQCCHNHGKYDLPNSSGHLVTDVVVFERLDVYSKFKVNDYVFLRSVKATKIPFCEGSQSEQIHLAIPSFSFPMLLDSTVDRVLQIESRLQDWTEDQVINKKGTHLNDNEKIQQVQDAPPSNDKAVAEHFSKETQVTSKCEKYAIKYKSNQRSMNLKNKLKPNKYVSSVCDNKVCVTVGNSKEESVIIKDLGGEQVITTKEPCGQRQRKQLFTENYTDLSDATDDISEVFEQVREVSVKGPSQVVVSPDNFSLENLIELVKTKYCSPRKGPSTSNLPEVASDNLSKKEETTGKNKIKTEDLSTGFQPEVKLVKLSDECANVNSKRKRSRRKKYSDEMKFDDSDENLENASTVVNLTLDNEESQWYKSQRNKRLRLDSDSEELLKHPIVNEKNSREPQLITRKVSSWLTQHADKDAEDLDLATVRQLMFTSENQETDNLSSFITSHVRRLHVFLLQVVPDPTKVPLDLISGHCLEGCQQLFLYSTIYWKEEDNKLFPLCPSCRKTELEKKLDLIFIVQLNVMDRNGNHETAIVCREHGETFFGCSVREFVMDVTVRRSRVQLLLDNTVFQSSRSGPFTSPLLDLSVVAVSNILCVINSKLKLPPDP